MRGTLNESPRECGFRPAARDDARFGMHRCNARAGARRLRLNTQGDDLTMTRGDTQRDA